MAVINGTPAGETLPGTATADTITGAGGNDKALMAGGNDVFIWNDGDGSDTVEGGVGTDTLDFNASAGVEWLDISAKGGRVQLTRNVGNVAMDLNDLERIEVQALGGADLVTIDNVTGTDLKQVVVDLSAGMPGVGDGAADSAAPSRPPACLLRSASRVPRRSMNSRSSVAAAMTRSMLPW
jgi:Ca2+-binding RTX toxin-like protein